jgi:hypothetical protein
VDIGAVDGERARDFGIDVLGHDDARVIAHRTADHGEGDAGVAGGGFDDGVAGDDATVALGVLDHMADDAVLDGACRVPAFELGVEVYFWVRREVVNANDWRVADGVDDVEVVHQAQCRGGPTPGSGLRDEGFVRGCGGAIVAEREDVAEGEA